MTHPESFESPNKRYRYSKGLANLGQDSSCPVLHAIEDVCQPNCPSKLLNSASRWFDTPECSSRPATTVVGYVPFTLTLSSTLKEGFTCRSPTIRPGHNTPKEDETAIHLLARVDVECGDIEVRYKNETPEVLPGFASVTSKCLTVVKMVHGSRMLQSEWVDAGNIVGAGYNCCIPQLVLASPPK